MWSCVHDQLPDVLAAQDELAGWFGSMGRYSNNASARVDESFWLSAYTGLSVVIDRRTGDPPMLHVEQALVALTGGIQPDIFARVMTPERRESGLAARLLLAYPPRRPKQWSDAGIISPAVFAALEVRRPTYRPRPTNVFG